MAQYDFFKAFVSVDRAKMFEIICMYFKCNVM